jgi:glycosyltransferase involved in cell wall biosynthesis
LNSSLETEKLKTPLHLWLPGLTETGGIQHYSVCLLQALRVLYPENEVVVFAKNDLPTAQSSAVEDPMVTVHGFGHLPGHWRTLAFAASGLAAALRDRPLWVLTTHPHFMKALQWLPKSIPMLSSAHGVEVWGHLHGGLGRAMRRATALLPVSQCTADHLATAGQVPRSRLHVLPNTFREKLFSPGPKPAALLSRYGLKPDQPVLLTLARLAANEGYKGQDQVLQALPTLLKSFPNLRYLIGGTGDDAPRLRQLASELGVEQAVTFTGFVPESELADHYRLADLYVMPSTGEGFGIVYLESLACGRPCLVGNRDASPEALDGGRLGLVVDPRDPQAIAQAIHDFLTQQDGKPWLHKPATLHQEVSRLFGFEAFKQQLAEALKRVVE